VKPASSTSAEERGQGREVAKVSQPGGTTSVAPYEDQGCIRPVGYWMVVQVQPFGRTIVAARGSLAPGPDATRFREKQHSSNQTADEFWSAARVVAPSGLSTVDRKSLGCGILAATGRRCHGVLFPEKACLRSSADPHATSTARHSPRSVRSLWRLSSYAAVDSESWSIYALDVPSNPRGRWKFARRVPLDRKLKPRVW